VIKTADWIVDLGPEGGAGGGQVLAQGTPEAIAAVETSYTGRYLKPVLTAQATGTGNGRTQRAASGARAARKASGDLLR